MPLSHPKIELRGRSCTPQEQGSSTLSKAAEKLGAGRKTAGEAHRLADGGRDAFAGHRVSRDREPDLAQFPLMNPVWTRAVARLAYIGFPAGEAAELSALHTRNFM